MQPRDALDCLAAFHRVAAAAAVHMRIDESGQHQRLRFAPRLVLGPRRAFDSPNAALLVLDRAAHESLRRHDVAFDARRAHACAPHLGHEIVIVAAAIRMRELDRLPGVQIADARDEQDRAPGRHFEQLREPRVGVERAQMLQRAHRCAAQHRQMRVQRCIDLRRVGQHLFGQHADFVGHHHVVGQAQPLEARDARAGRQAQRELLVGRGGGADAREPARRRREAALVQLLGKAGQARQRLLEPGCYVVARAAPAHDQSLLDQLIDRLARGHARQAERFRQHALGRQRLVGLVVVVAYRLRELLRELHVQRRGRSCVGAEFERAVFHRTLSPSPPSAWRTRRSAPSAAVACRLDASRPDRWFETRQQPLPDAAENRQRQRALGVERGGDFLERARRAVEQGGGKWIGRGGVEYQRRELGVGVLPRPIAPAQQRLARRARQRKNRPDQRTDAARGRRWRDASRASRAIRAMRRCLRRRREIPTRRRPRADRRGAALRRRCRCRPRRSRRAVLRVRRARSCTRRCPVRSHRTAARGGRTLRNVAARWRRRARDPARIARAARRRVPRRQTRCRRLARCASMPARSPDRARMVPTRRSPARRRRRTRAARGYACRRRRCRCGSGSPWIGRGSTDSMPANEESG